MKASSAKSRVNKLKELLVYSDLNEQQICREIGYASIQEMKEELWQHTGLQISFYKELKAQKEYLQNRTFQQK